MKLTVRLIMLSDWHIGTGTGRYGSVNRAVQRDRSGLPFVPAKTLTGVWRAGCEIAAAALDRERGSAAAHSDVPGGGDDWQAWVHHLFGGRPSRRPADGGGPQAAALLVNAAHYPSAMVRELAERPLLREAAVFLKPGVEIERRTGASDPGKLRFQEMGRCGAELLAHADVPDMESWHTEQQRAAQVLLAAGAGLVDELGGKRRRGAGRCRVEVNGLAPDWDWLRTGPAAPVTPARHVAPTRTHRAPAHAAGRVPKSASGEEWEVAELRLVLEQPVIAHERTVGNAIRSMDHLPGWMLLPGVLERLGSERAAAAARAGRMVITNAVPEVGGEQGRPVPRALVHAKGASGDQRNLLVETPGPGFLAESFDGGWVGSFPIRAGERTVPRMVATGHSEHMHNTIDDAVQRPTERVGGLYSYQALAEGSVLRAEVRVPAGLLTPNWERELAGRWRLGRSRKDGYGRVRVSSGARAATTVERRDARPLLAGSRVRVWLLSDVLLRDARLRPSTDPAALGAVLGHELGVRLMPADVSPDGVDGDGAPETLFTEARRHDSWQRRWGLPRPSLLGLRAGSCLTFEVLEGQLDSKAVARVELTGVGERRAEGFGQLRIDDPLLTTPLVGASTAPADGTGHRQGDGPAGSAAAQPSAVGTLAADRAEVPVLRSIVAAAWRKELGRRAEALAAEPDGLTSVLGSGHERVPPAQLGALRALLDRLTGPADPVAAQWLKQLGDTRTRDRLWPVSVRERLGALLGHAPADSGTDAGGAPPGQFPGAKLWAVLALPEAALSTPTVTAETMRRELWAEAARTLIGACLIAHARRSREPFPLAAQTERTAG